MGPSFHEVKMKNHALVLTLMTAIAWSTPALAAEFPFESIEFDEAAKRAKAEGKPILVKVYATWCGPCKRMDRSIFGAEPVLEKASELVAMKVDGDTEYGGKFKTRFDVSKYPTTLFFNAQGEMVHKLIGAGSLDGFMKLLLAHLENRLTMDGVQAPQIAGEAELRTWIGAATERPDDKRPDLTAALEADDPNIASFARWAEAHWGEGVASAAARKKQLSNSQRRTEILRFNPSQPSVLLNNGRRVGRGKKGIALLEKELRSEDGESAVLPLGGLFTC